MACILCLVLACSQAGTGPASGRRAGPGGAGGDGERRGGGAGDTVILLHGLRRGPGSMLGMRAALERAGFVTVNLAYPSTRMGLEGLAARCLDPAVRQARSRGGRVHFVTHSMGGMVLRAWLAGHSLPEGSRIVMLAPPNQGSVLAARLSGLALYRVLHGPAGLELAAPDLPAALGPVRARLGVIAGTRSLNPLFSLLVPGPDDGKVGVAETRVAGMDAHLVLPVTHTWMMWNPRVVRETVHFLCNGTFSLPGATHARRADGPGPPGA